MLTNPKPKEISKHASIGLALFAFALLLCGCAGSSHGPYSSVSAADRNPLEAQRLTILAADLLEQSGKLNHAETLLKSALAADIYHGPAHNNLGVVYFKSTPPKLYEAASEFEWARKLMPGNPEPRTNLAMTLERAGRTDEALATYRAALDASPQHIQSIQAFTRLAARSGATDDQSQWMLKEIAIRGTTEQWRDWARGQLSKQ